MIPELLYDLAPTGLSSFRSVRFDGAGYEVTTTGFAEADRGIITRMYRDVQGLLALWNRAPNDPDYPALEEYLVRLGDGTLLTDARQLGVATQRSDLDAPAARKAAHDIRGGGLCMLLGCAEMLAATPGDRNLVRKCVDSARDHAKIMRNLLPDIDPEVRRRDEAAKAHGITLFTSKWEGMAAQGPNGPVTVGVHCEFVGAISARCLETSSIDRVIYNYVNNAVRFAAGPAVTIWVFPVGRGLTRWVVQNAIAPAEAAFLAGQGGPGMANLFAGGLTRGGTGIGLANCAEIVTDCFGLDTPAEAVRAGYLGAAVRGSEYFAWFHWPAFVLN